MKFLNSSLKEIISSDTTISELRTDIENGEIIIIKTSNFFDKNLLSDIKKYLASVGKNSLPNYHEIQRNTPNHHRVNMEDKRSYVAGCFHQFSFFPWNQDIFNLFVLFRDVFYVKNLISNVPKENFLSANIDGDCTARISAQFYPAGKGWLQCHKDPIAYHQLVVPVMPLSTMGVDYDTGGGYVLGENNKKTCTDKFCEVGDILLFNANMAHGVDIIDSKKKKISWNKFIGRWILLFAVNKIAGNNKISDSEAI
jgi:hypothetical protein